MLDSTQKASIEEIYQVAGNTSDLTVEADRRGAGDILLAAGWSASRVGMGLLRLHSEYDSSEKPPKPTPASIKAMVGTYQRALPNEPRPDGKPLPLTAGAAKHYASAWYSHEVAMLLQKLKALPSVREQITFKAAQWRMAEPTAKAASVIRFWLDQTCPACHGLKWQITPGAPSLSNRMCKVCGGSGIGQVPHGSEGRRLANFMDSCVEDARGVMKRNLSSTRRARNKVVDTPDGRVIIKI